MPQKIALVTGASSGFGKEIALLLSQSGYYVFATARRGELLRSLANDSLESYPLDVTDDESIKACMQHILATKGQIDLLVNNAGHGFYSTLEDADMKDVHHQFNVNVFGVVRMTQAVLPSMRSQKSGMIINISSISGHISMPIFGFYAGTKHAVEALSDALRMEVRQFGIKTVIVEPGIFKTNFRETALHTIRKSHKTKAYDKLVNTEMKYLADLYDKAPDPAKVAKLIAKIAKTKHPKRRHVVGKGSKTFLFIKKVFGYKLIDFILRKKFGA